MSLVVVRKFENQLSIVSDTKLSYAYHEIKNQKTNPSEGVIKTVILRPDVTISFAGEIEAAENALSEISTNTSVEKIIDILKFYHKQSNFKTEFLLCFASPEVSIYKFKNNQYGIVESSWIGDSKAFNEFQSNMMGTRKKPKKEKKSSQKNNLSVDGRPTILFEQMGLLMEQQINSLFSKMSSAMDEVINTSSVDCVGGFKVQVVFKEIFFYNFYLHTYRSEFSLVGEGTHNISHGDASEGAYTINFFGGSLDYLSVALHIKQAELGIIYHRKDNGLLYPLLFKLDEVDFVDFVKERYAVYPPILTQDRVHKFVNEGKQAFTNKNYKQANMLFDKAIENAKDKQKAEVLFLKGITLINLKENEKALVIFREAIKLDPMIETRIKMAFT
jgi:tetratricopeptide (TPR) repeat protein